MRCAICGKDKNGLKEHTIQYGYYNENKYASKYGSMTHVLVQTSEKTVGEISGGVCNLCKLKSLPKNLILSPLTSVVAFILGFNINGILGLLLILFSIIWLIISFFLFCFGYLYVSNIGEYLLFFKNRKKLTNSGYNGIKLGPNSPMFQFGRTKNN
jgi:hypothetical protein